MKLFEHYIQNKIFYKMYHLPQSDVVFCTYAYDDSGALAMCQTKYEVVSLRLPWGVSLVRS